MISMHKHIISFIKFLLITLAPFFLIVILELLMLKRVRFFDMLIVQSIFASILGGTFGVAIGYFRNNKLAYRLLLFIFIILYLIIVLYLVWIFLLDLTPFHYKDI